MTDLSFLTARPIAHRGYHDTAEGRVENTLSAVQAAVDRGFAIEIDVHLSADGQVFVFHDWTLDRLTRGTGPIAGLSLQDLKSVPFKTTDDRIPSLREVLDAVGGKVPLVIEVKSEHSGPETELVAALARELGGYEGHIAVMSFSPAVVLELKRTAPHLVRGIVADDAEDEEYAALSPAERHALATLAHAGETEPHFVSYWVKLLPNAVSRKVREDWKLPLITWTVRTPEDRLATERHADQMTFEGFDPDA